MAKRKTADEPLYRIKPLEWGYSKSTDGYESWYASTPFGNYSVDTFERIRWRYCFDECYDEDQFNADSVEEAKAAAEKHWRERIGGALEDLTPSPKTA